MTAALATVLSVENIEVKAFHGWYQEERKIGGRYIVHVHMIGSAPSDTSFEHLEHSVNYELIYQKVLETMAKEFHLIEHAAKAIFDAVKQLAEDHVWEIELIKMEPPLKFVGKTSFKLKG